MTYWRTKKNTPIPPSGNRKSPPLFLALQCNLMTYDRIPLHLGPSIFPFFVCLYHLLQLPANQITPTIVCNKHRTDNILRYIHRMICTICRYFLCIEANGSCVTFMLECLQTIVNTYLSEMKMMFLNDTTHAHILIIFLDYAER